MNIYDFQFFAHILIENQRDPLWGDVRYPLDFSDHLWPIKNAKPKGGLLEIEPNFISLLIFLCYDRLSKWFGPETIEHEHESSRARAFPSLAYARARARKK